MTTLDAVSSVRSGTTASWSHTVGAGSNRLLLVFACAGHRSAFSSVTYGGTALTFVGRAQDTVAVNVEVWIFVNPPTGTATIVATPTFDNDCECGGLSFSNVDQTTPLGSLSTSIPGANVTSISGSITDSTSADIIVAGVSVGDSSFTVTPGAGQTNQGNPGNGFPGNQAEFSTQAGTSGTVTPSFTISSAARTVLATVAVKDGTSAAPPWRRPAIQSHASAMARASVM